MASLDIFKSKLNLDDIKLAALKEKSEKKIFALYEEYSYDREIVKLIATNPNTTTPLLYRIYCDFKHEHLSDVLHIIVHNDNCDSDLLYLFINDYICGKNTSFSLLYYTLEHNNLNVKAVLPLIQRAFPNNSYYLGMLIRNKNMFIQNIVELIQKNKFNECAKKIAMEKLREYVKTNYNSLSQKELIRYSEILLVDAFDNEK